MMKNDRFAKDADLLLGSLTWTQADTNRVLSDMKGAQPRMKKKMSLGLVLAIVLVLLAAAALAAGLVFSPRYTTLQTARNAVMEKYGLNQHMLRLYMEHEDEADGVTTVRFAGCNSEFLQTEPMGEYTVTVDQHGKATAAWSHDGADMEALADGNLAASVWGPAQLQRVIDYYAYYQQWQQETPYVSLLPIAEQAKRVAELDQAIAPCKVALDRTDVPDEADLTEEEALSLATKALGEHYGITLTDKWRVERHFQAESADGRRFVFSFQKDDEEKAHSVEAYTVSVLSPSGEIVLGDNELTSFIDPNETESPATQPTSDISVTEARAVEAAKQALARQYGLTDEMITLFAVKPSLDASNGQTSWTVAFLPVDHENFYEEGSQLNPDIDWRWIDTLTQKLGSYQVQVSAESGEVLETSWSLDGKQGVYTDSDWGSAEAFDAGVLPRVFKLLAQNKPIVAKYPDDQTEWFSLEDAAAYDQSFRDAGFTDGCYNHALPKDGDLTVEEAAQIACQAMVSEGGLTQSDLDEAQMLCEYVLDNGGEWWISFYTAQGINGVDLNAATGEIQDVQVDTGEGGNG